MLCDNHSSDQPLLYSDADRALLMAHIQKHFGTIAGIGQTLLPTGRPLELLAVNTPDRKHLGKLFAPAGASSSGKETLLLTFGAGACSMRVPKDSELPPRAEYLMRLPSDWNIQSDDESCLWPVRLLLNIASLPETEQSYNAGGHTFSFTQGTPFAENTLLCSAILTGMNDREGQCRLTSGEAVTFYEAIPLYAEELEFTTEHEPVALVDEFIRYDIPRVVTPDRVNVAVLAKRRPELVASFQSMEKDAFQKMAGNMNALPLEERVALKETLSQKGGLIRHTAQTLSHAMQTMFRKNRP